MPYLHGFPARAVAALGLLLALLFSATVGNSTRSLATAPGNSSVAEVTVSAAAAQSAAEKLSRIQQAASSGGAGSQTAFSEEEVNSYLAYKMEPDYPAGLSKVQVNFVPGRILGTARVDFDKAMAARQPLGGMADYLFWGLHTLAVEGGFSAVDGVGRFDLESVALDGYTLPQKLVDLLIETFLKPRYPNLALDRPFLLPYSIDRVEVMRERVEVVVNPPVTE
jgi:hypothetical protein